MVDSPITGWLLTREGGGALIGDHSDPTPEELERYLLQPRQSQLSTRDQVPAQELQPRPALKAAEVRHRLVLVVIQVAVGPGSGDPVNEGDDQGEQQRRGHRHRNPRGDLEGGGRDQLRRYHRRRYRYDRRSHRRGRVPHRGSRTGLSLTIRTGRGGDSEVTMTGCGAGIVCTTTWDFCSTMGVHIVEGSVERVYCRPAYSVFIWKLSECCPDSSGVKKTSKYHARPSIRLVDRHHFNLSRPLGAGGYDREQLVRR